MGCSLPIFALIHHLVFGFAFWPLDSTLLRCLSFSLRMVHICSWVALSTCFMLVETWRPRNFFSTVSVSNLAVLSLIQLSLKFCGFSIDLIEVHSMLQNSYPMQFSQKLCGGASLVVQWLRICLPMQGIRVRALVWEDPTCHGATGPVSHNYWACASGACAPQQEGPR